MIQRLFVEIIEKWLGSGKAIILLGPRRIGKTTLLQKIVSKHENPPVLNCDNPFVRQQLLAANTGQLRQIIGTLKLIFVDEAQRIKTSELH